MEFLFNCPKCSGELTAAEQFVGSKEVCVHCKEQILVPLTQDYLNLKGLQSIACSKCSFTNGYSEVNKGKKIKCLNCGSKILTPFNEGQNNDKEIENPIRPKKNFKKILISSVLIIIFLGTSYRIIFGPKKYNFAEIKSLLKDHSFYLLTPESRESSFQNINCRKFTYKTNYSDDNVFLNLYVSFDDEFMGLSMEETYPISKRRPFAFHRVEYLIEDIMSKNYGYMDMGGPIENLKGPIKAKDNRYFDNYYNDYGKYYYFEFRQKLSFSDYSSEKKNRIGIFLSSNDFK